MVGVNGAHACTGVPVASLCALWRVTGRHWTSLGAYGAASAVRVSVVGGYQQVEWSEEKRGDMVRHGRVDQREDELVVCHAMHGMTCFSKLLYKPYCLWYWSDARSQ